MKMFIAGLIIGVTLGFELFMIAIVLAADTGKLNRDPTKEEWKAGFRRRR